MSIKSRQYLRAPVHRWALYSEEDYLLRGKVMDISHGGLLLGELSLLPKDRELEILFELPHYEDFSKTNWQHPQLGSYHVQTTIFRQRIQIVRHYQRGDALTAIFENIGAVWTSADASFLEEVDRYVGLYRKNLRYILSLFETSGKNKANDQLILFLSSLLGIKVEGSLAHLRTRLMHLYQSVSQL